MVVVLPTTTPLPLSSSSLSLLLLLSLSLSSSPPSLSSSSSLSLSLLSLFFFVVVVAFVVVFVAVVVVVVVRIKGGNKTVPFSDYRISAWPPRALHVTASIAMNKPPLILAALAGAAAWLLCRPVGPHNACPFHNPHCSSSTPRPL